MLSVKIYKSKTTNAIAIEGNITEMDTDETPLTLLAASIYNNVGCIVHEEYVEGSTECIYACTVYAFFYNIYPMEECRIN